MFLFSSIYSFAQATGTIKGTVKDANGQPLQGASVQVQGSRGGTTTDNSGNYSLSAPTGKRVLIISFVGFGTQRMDVVVTEGTTLQQDAALSDVGDLTNVTVIGSRNASRTRVQTPVPVDVIPISQVINEIGQVDVNQILNFIAPSFQSARQTISDGTDHVDPAQLRGLGTDQVLVLINGKRRHQSALVNVNGTVNRGQVGTDMSAIPATSIDRIEILRDGAAAQYGSDAIAGVINIVLKKRTGLLEAGISYGGYVTNYDKNFALYKITNKADDPSVKVTDGNTLQGSIGYGFGIGKGYLSVTGEFINRLGTNRTGTYTGAVYPNVGGVNRDDSIMAARGQTRNTFDMRVGNSAMKGGAGFYNFGYPIGANGELYVFGGYSKKKGEATGVYRYPSGIPGNATTYASNVFALYPNGFLPEIHSDIIDFSTAAGFRTKFNDWNFDISNTFGMNKFEFGVENSVNYSQFAVAGNNQTKFDAGGLKFLQNTVNADISKKYNVLQGLNVAAGLEYRFESFGLISGEEASYKNFDVNSKAAAAAQVFPGFVNTIGDDKTRNAKAIYIDLEQDFTDKFLLTGALRFENYSDFGSTLNYKFSSRYKFSEAFNIRASLSSGFRAPSMQQRFFAKTNTLFVSQGGILVPVQAGTFTNDSDPARILGIPKLKEETSQNYSVGFTARPFTGFELTVDAYQIDIDNRIILTNNFTGGNNAQLKAQLDAVGASTANFFTNAIDTRARGLEAVASYNVRFLRKHSLRTTLAMTFIDNEVKKGSDGKPIIHASDILVSSGQLANYFNREDQSRVEVASPKNKISLAFNYKYSKFSVMLRFVNFGKVIYLDPSIDPANPGVFPMNAFNGNQRETLDQEFSAKTVTDLSLSYQIITPLAITIGANNLFDVYQDKHTHSGNMSTGRFVYSRRVQQMGFNGAYYFARLKLTIDTKK
ncbi:MAG: TonB-dependent receptor [Chitinophagaceae bacterium]|nr:TonB-dependent receptor [Chitinophagaceae bacterium]